MIYRKVLDNITRNRERRLTGELIAIPWSLSNFSRIVPGVEQGKFVLVSATPKAGKTQLCDFLFVYEPFEWYLRNKNHHIKPRVLYFSLEMSRESKIFQAISYKLNKDYNIVISPQHLKSTFQNYILDKQVYDIINSTEFKVWLNEFESNVTFIDSIRSPNEIYDYVLNYALKHGRLNEETKEYTPDNPDEYVIIVLDHMSLLSPDKGSSLFEAMYNYSAYKCLEFRDKFNYIPVVVQQQSAESSKQQFTYRGDSIIEKIRPSPDGLADMRLSARDVNLMISLFNPTSFRLPEYEGLDLGKIGRWHRELYLNLNRDYFPKFGKLK
jgi:KaiC/GvpD/RAD55 family RecA-like ATPase